MAAPWHRGELALQERAGAAARMAEIGPRAIRNFMPDQHRGFFAQLPFLLAGHQDARGQVWASLLAGPPGFATSPDPATLTINTRPLAHDPLTDGLAPGLPLAILGIELPTRRRNRANGHVLSTGPDGFTLGVEESFGNCPKYIARRDYEAAPVALLHSETLEKLDGTERELIASSTGFFVASSPGAGKLPDVSHRGGSAGFVRIEPDGTLAIPDYTGNFFFNTLGNFLLYPRAGLLFPDFVSGDLLQLTGTAWLADDDSARALPGAERIWRFRTTAGHWLRGVLPFRATKGEASPFWPAPVDRRTSG